mmetsp:Transcript_82863/g.267116  ORF Transcript_82863/g.267116 Transcript_82863/m.267116 type:complete len:227 (-) Transcript_82863:360-1040(-)
MLLRPWLTPRFESQEEEQERWADEADVEVVVYPICVAGGCCRRMLAGSGSNGGRCCCCSSPLAGDGVSSKCGRPCPRSRPSNAQSSGVVAAGVGSPPEVLPSEWSQATCKSPTLGVDGERQSPPLPPPPPSASKTRAPPPSSRPPPPSSSCWRATRLEGDLDDTGDKSLPRELTLPEVAESPSAAEPPSEERSNIMLEDDRMKAREGDGETERTLQKPSTKDLVEV